MNKHNHAEDQAVMNLLFICDDQYVNDTFNNYPDHEFKALNEDRHKFKSNTVHVRTLKNTFYHTQIKTETQGSSLDCTDKPSKNKENLKKILQKLQNSPSPPRKCIEKSKPSEFGRVLTQNSEQVSKSKSNYDENKTAQFVKKSLDKLFNKKKDKDFIKSLIKAKIVEKLKKIQSKKSGKKVYQFVSRMGTLRQSSSKRTQKERTTTLRTEKSMDKSKYINLIREEHHINHPLYSRKNSKINLKKLLF